MARVGVWTRPAAVMLKPPWRELKQVRARVALRPTSQSDSERHWAASASGCISSSVRRLFPGLEDRVVGHRLHPEPLDRLLDVADVHDVAEDEFALAAGVAGVDDAVDVLALGELEDLLEAGFGAFDRIELEVFGDGGQDVEVPGQLVLAVAGDRHAQLDEVADGGGDDRWSFSNQASRPLPFFSKRPRALARARVRSVATEGFSAMMSVFPMACGPGD